MEPKEPVRLIATTLAFILVAIIVYTLSITRGLLIPLVVGFVIAYFIITLHQAIQSFLPEKIHFLRTISILLAIMTLGSLIWVLFSIISTNIAAFIQAAPAYQQNLQVLIAKVSNLLHLKEPWDPGILFENFNFVNMASQVALLLTDIASNASMIFLYLLFFLIEYSYFDEKLAALCRLESRKAQVETMLSDILSQIQKYLKVKTLMSLVTASCSYLVLIAVGVQFPVLWATLIFIMNFIPTIGSIIATLFPCILTLVQFASLVPFIIVSIALSSVQIIVGNILEPRVMGKSFNLSGLMIIFSLSIWYAIWGVIGMFLCIPLTVIISIVLANFPETRWIAVLLSQSGSLAKN